MYSPILNRMFDLHYTREKLNDEVRPMRIELEHMRAEMLYAQDFEKAGAIKKQRSALKKEFKAKMPVIAGVDRELSKLSRSIPGNYLMLAKSGQIDRIPEPLRNFRGWARRLTMKWK